MPRIFILRHGETEGNQKRVFRGLWDLPLNENGQIQAARTGNALKGIKFSRIYTSPLIRAKETAGVQSKPTQNSKHWSYEGMCTLSRAPYVLPEKETA